VLALGHWGELHRDRGEYEQAEEKLRQAIETGKQIELTFYLSGIFYHLAELLHRAGRIGEAGPVCREAMHLLREDGRMELLFSCELLSWRIRAASEPQAAIAGLGELLARANGDDQRAEAMLSLYRIAGGESYRADAARLYQTLWQQCPLEQYRRALRELGKEVHAEQKG
jgi:tetratricopeptide (TPR) repeat protein